MKPSIFLGSLLASCTLGVPAASGACFPFTVEHVDVLSATWDATQNHLSLLASDDTHGRLYASNECVVICPPNMRFTLPAGTPLGNEGDSMWILPQNPYADVPYVGVSAQTVPAETFAEPFTIRLTRVDGPGHFLLWQAGSFGSFEVKIDTRDGVGSGDAITLPVGGHAHYNWGFTTNGIYRLYFQVSGLRPGQSARQLSPETPFTFHILPLRPFETWTATNWPCECATNIIAARADPDGDGVMNVLEYAFGSDPRVNAPTNLPALRRLTLDGATYGALEYTHALDATDLALEPVVADRPDGAAAWLSMSNLVEAVDGGPGLQKTTVRDSLPMSGTNARFFQLRVRLQP